MSLRLGSRLTLVKGKGTTTGVSYSGTATASFGATGAMTITTLGVSYSGTVATSFVASGAMTAPSAYVAPTLLAANFSDDFEVPATSTATFTARSNWSAMDLSFANLEVTGGYAHGTVQYGPNGSAFLGTDIADQIATFNYSTIDLNGDVYDDGGRQYFYMWYQDTNNHIRVALVKNLSRVAIVKVVSGATTTTEFANATILSAGEVRVFVRNGKFEVMLDGQWLKAINGIYSYPYDVVDYSSMSSGAKTGRVGFYSQLWRYPILNAIKVQALSLGIDSCDTFVGESTIDGTGGYARLAMTMAAGASPSRWDYRLLTPGTLAEVKAWASMTSVSVVGSAVTAQAFIPTGGPYIIEAAYTDSSDGKARSNYTKPVRSGVLIGVFGQSNAFNRRGQVDATPALNVKIAGASTDLNSNVISGAPAGAWTTSTDAYTPGCMYECARVLSGLIGKPVGIFATGNPSTGIVYNSPGGGGWATFTTAVAAYSGIVRAVIWDQGENDADGVGSPTGYSSTFLTSTLPGFRSVTGNANLPVFISPVGRFASTSPPYVAGGAAQGDNYRDVLRQQYFAIVAGDAKTWISDWKLGTNHGADAYHYQADVNGYPEMGRRAAYSIAKNAFGVSTADGTGALPVSASRTTNVIDITVNLNGGNAITGPTSLSTGTAGTSTLTALNGWQVSTDNFATTLTISSVTVVGGKIRLTLAANPGTGGKVRFCYGYSYDDSNLVYTTYADGRGNIPVQPFATPLTFT